MTLLHWPQALGENKIKTSKPSTCTFIPPLYLSSALNEGIAWPCWWNVNIPWQACVCSPLSSSEGGMDICLLYASHSYYISTGTHVLQHWSQMSRAKWRANIPGCHYKTLPSFTGSTLRPKTNNRSFPVPNPSQGGSRREKEGTSSGRGQKKSCRSFFMSVLTATQSTNNACRNLSPFAQSLLSFPPINPNAKGLSRCWCVYVKRGNSCDWNLMIGAKHVLRFENVAMLKATQSISERIPVFRLE